MTSHYQVKFLIKGTGSFNAESIHSNSIKLNFMALAACKCTVGSQLHGKLLMHYTGAFVMPFTVC